MEPTSIQLDRIKSTLSIQFPGIQFEKLVKNITIQVSRKTGRIRGIIDADTDERLFSLRTSDGRFVPTFEGGKRLLASGQLTNRVVMNRDAEPYVAKGKSAFCKFVVDTDHNIQPGGEVLLVNEDNELLAVGTAVQPGYAMLELTSGVAVNPKHSRD